MAKRFTDTDKYKKSFFRGLPAPYKLLWDFLYHDCNHAGVWIADFDIAQIYLGSDAPVNKKDALKYFNNGEIRVIPLSNDKWFIKPFIEFQYGKLNEINRVHASVIKALKPYKGIMEGLSSAEDHPVYRAFKHLSMSLDEYQKLNTEYNKAQIDSILDAIENYANNKNYTSLYLTARKWLAKEHKGQKNSSDTEEMLKRMRTQ